MKALKVEKYIGIGLMVAGGVALVVAVPYAIKKYNASKAVVANTDTGKTEIKPKPPIGIKPKPPIGPPPNPIGPPPMIRPVSNFQGCPTSMGAYV